ncbi:ferredoxin [Ferroglobus placidus DSM 10642]|uniref:Ferredoxin n=1 Tax=Ferroglobus placidus (strain DSM 10642 / AEDII12DO) TaxID=589924 RepID=D3RZH9_FERPA|nr:ASKHA domain-containing protein [Ferroglobus placidus]ADC65892.1 ferredoxin [Ferroglobus placidus DSM 10642]
MEKCKIIFQPEGKRGEFPPGTTILDAAREIGVDIEAICGGKLTCGKCQVVIEQGEENLSQMTEDERRLLDKRKAGKNYRLACVTRFYGDVVVFVPEESRGGEQIILKEGVEVSVTIDPAVKKYYLELPKPHLKDDLGDFERILNALREDYGIENVDIDYEVLKKLPDVLRESDWKVTVTIWNDREIIDVEPGYKAENVYGLAVDIGTTTVVGYLTDLRTGKILAIDSMMNPQVPYGEDVMSRITYAMQNPEGLEVLNKKIVEGINQILVNVCKEAGIKPEEVSEVTIVGNTAMHHIFLKIDPQYLAVAPYVPAIHRSHDVKARDIGIKIAKGGNVHVLPIEAGWVGADNVAVLIATEPYKRDEMCLVIDIGTNGEIVLGNRERLLSCSAAAGPALEGAHIKHGMRAATGAIERIRIDPETFEPEYKTIGNAPPRGICGSGIIDAAAELYRVGIVKKNGRFNLDLDTPRVRVVDGQPEYVIAWANETAIGHDIVITQKDIREIQLAKGAMCAGAHILMKEMGVESVDRVIVAGAFGNYIDKISALIIGLVPDVPVDRIESVGNAAGVGARLALISREKRREANEIARKVEHIKLAVHPDFEREFSMAMYFPHMDKKRYPRHEEVLKVRGAE